MHYVIDDIHNVAKKLISILDQIRLKSEDVFVVTGHTPTQGIIGNPRPGYIFKGLNHIAIDCG